MGKLTRRSLLIGAVIGVVAAPIAARAQGSTTMKIVVPYRRADRPT